jgi:hypothetical protein
MGFAFYYDAVKQKTKRKQTTANSKTSFNLAQIKTI